MTAILTVTLNPAVDVSAATVLVEPIRKLRCSDERRHPGGGGINVARVVTRLGGACRALYPAGGTPGQLLHRLLEAEGIGSDPVDVSTDTRECFTIYEQSSGLQYRFVLPGGGLDEMDWQACLARLAALVDGPAYVVLSGSLPANVPADTIARMARIAKAQGARVVLDTSGEALALALAEGVFLVKPNLGELSRLAGRPLPEARAWERAAVEIVLAGGAEAVALTLGDQGAFLAGARFRLRAAPIAVEVASAVGAGDCFLAGMVHRLTAGADWREAFRYGMAAGTAALLTPGTELCRREDVERLYAEVEISAGAEEP